MNPLHEIQKDLLTPLVTELRLRESAVLAAQNEILRQQGLLRELIGRVNEQRGIVDSFMENPPCPLQPSLLAERDRSFAQIAA